MSETPLLERFQAAVAGTWSVEREIGRGGMGVVLLARDVALDRPVAIKLLDPDLAGHDEHRRRFLREARTGAGLAHPHIVPIYDVVETDAFVFFVMAAVDGESVGDRLRRDGPMPPAAVEQLLRETGWALAAAHAAGVLHRDVTIDNILLERTSGRTLLADFGIATTIDGGEAGPLIGTPAYLAPELVRGEPPTPASDLYALGITGWTMLTGRVPFLDEEPGKVLLRQLTDDIPPLARAAAGTPSQLARAVESLLHKDPAARPASVEQWLGTLSRAAPVPQLATPLDRWLKQRDAMRPFYAFAATGIGVLGPAAALLVAGAGEAPGALVFAVLSAGLVSLLVVQCSLAVRSAANTIAEGFRLDDLRVALARQRQEREAAGVVQPSGVGRAIRLAGTAAILGTIVGIAVMSMGAIPSVLPWQLRVWLWENLAQVILWGWMAFWASRGLGFVVPGKPKQPDDRRRRWRRAFWDSPVAAWLHRGLARLVRPRSAAVTLHRPTELVLGLQIEDIWDALPPLAKRGLDDLPATARALRYRLADLRRVLGHLDGDTRDAAEVQAIREHLVARREAAFAALERLRLLTLRLAGEVSSEGEFTRQLRDARELELELLGELGAHPDVGRLIARRQTPTLATT